LKFEFCGLEYKIGGGEILCQEEMELDRQEKDPEQAEVSEEAAAVGAWAGHSLELDQAATAFAQPAET